MMKHGSPQLTTSKKRRVAEERLVSPFYLLASDGENVAEHFNG